MVAKQQVKVLVKRIDANMAKPEPHKPVIAFYIEGGRKRWSRAQWVPKHSEEDTGNYEGEPDYDEATDTFYWPEGWYEWNNCDETLWLITEDVTHWAAVEFE